MKLRTFRGCNPVYRWSCGRFTLSHWADDAPQGWGWFTRNYAYRLELGRWTFHWNRKLRRTS